MFLVYFYRRKHLWVKASLKFFILLIHISQVGAKEPVHFVVIVLELKLIVLKFIGNKDSIIKLIQNLFQLFCLSLSLFFCTEKLNLLGESRVVKYHANQIKAYAKNCQRDKKLSVMSKWDDH